MDIQNQKPSDTEFIIPVKMDNFENDLIPVNIRKAHYSEYSNHFAAIGYY